MSHAGLRAVLERIEEADEFRAKARLSRKIERAAARDLAAAFERQGAAFLRGTSRMRAQFPAGTATEAPRLADWDRILAAALSGTRATFLRILGRLGREGVALGARRLIATLGLGVSFTLRNPRAVAFLQRFGADRVAGLEATTRDDMRRILVQAIDNGWSYNRTQAAIRATFADYSRARATRIAVTEAAFAYEHGRAVVARDLAAGGLSMQKSWLTVRDAKVDPICADAESAGWIGIDEDFPAGGSSPPAHPGCRCVTLYRRRRARG